MPSFAQEILNRIAGFMGTTELKDISVVSREFRAAAQAMLFAQLCRSGLLSSWPMQDRCADTIKHFFTAEDHRHLAMHVRALLPR